MKILHILNHSFPLLDGYATRSQNILKAQINMGWKPIVLTSPKHENDLKKRIPEKETIDDVCFYRTGRNPLESIPLVSESMQLLMVLKALIGVVKEENPDIIHAHSPVLNFFPGWLIGKIMKVPVLYEIRAFWEDAGVDQGKYKKASLKYRVVRTMETLACKYVDHVAVLCDGIRKDLLARGIGHDKLTPVFNGIHPDNFSQCAPDANLADKWGLSGKKVIGFIGSFYKYEGLDLLIEAFSLVAKKNPDVYLLIAGGGEEEGNLRHLVNSLGIGDRVVMPGRVPYHQVKGVYAMMDLLVYPRYSIRLTELVTPLKPLEAMAMGKTVVAGDIGGHRELIKHNETGVLFPVGDVGALAQVIMDMLQDEQKRKEIGKVARDFVLENKTWEKTTSVYRSIYSKLLGLQSLVLKKPNLYKSEL